MIALSAAESRSRGHAPGRIAEELELLRDGTGPLRVCLEELGAWDATAIRPGTRPLDYLRLLATAHRALVIHGNYLDDEEIRLARRPTPQRMTVVYCPRTHDWFGHGAYPLEKMLAAGVAVALGTDGRGSSPDLSLLAEMRFAAQQHPAVGRERILQMGTILGARALGREREIGSLEPGKQADLAVVALPDRDAADPHELLFDSQEPVVGCYFAASRASDGNARMTRSISPAIAGFSPVRRLRASRPWAWSWPADRRGRSCRWTRWPCIAAWTSARPSQRLKNAAACRTT